MSKLIFSEKDYNCKNGFCTKIWGPIFWTMLHFISFNYPLKPTTEDKAHYYIQVVNLQYTLPCGSCRDNMKYNLKKCPLLPKHLKTRKSFSKWMFKFHETINKMLGKESGLTYEEVRDKYEHFRARCDNDIVKNGKEKGCIYTKSGIDCRTLISVIPNDKRLKSSFKVDKHCLWKKRS